MCSKFGYFFLVGLLILFTDLSNAQTEYIVTVNPINGAITKVDSIPGVTWLRGYYMPAYSEYNHQYTFAGGDDRNGNPFYLFTVDAISGQTLFNPLFQDHTNFYHMCYANQSNTLYGIIQPPGSASSLVSLNKTNCSYVVIRSFPELQALVKLIMDDANNRYFILGQMNNFVYLLTYDLTTGNLLSQIPVNSIRFPTYNRLSEKFYGILIKNPTPPQNRVQYSLCSIDRATGTITTFPFIPNIAGFTPGCETLDENGNRYFFAGYEWGDTSYYLYTLDANNGNLIYKVRVPERNVIDDDNLIQFRYDNYIKKLYALYWEAYTNNQSPPPGPGIDSTCRLDSITKTYFNGAKDLIIDKKPTSCKVVVNIYNIAGQSLILKSPVNDGLNELPFSKFPAGTYIFEFISNGKKVFTKKILHY
ncbi:MAG: T9SS type A sorting domain-containing protein [Sphingobacteriales bacterium]|nr:T9SS type A sorting domain-containing protein [Sphingobacteriales bacterium]